MEWTEFLHLMRSTEFKITKEEITENFHSLDTNSDDKLTREGYNVVVTFVQVIVLNILKYFRV